MRETLYDVQMLWNEFRSLQQFSHLSKYCRLDHSFEIEYDGLLSSYEVGRAQGAWEMFLIIKGYNLRR